MEGKLEKWRVQELVLVLKDLVDTLNRSDNREWANVFDHFLGEAESLLLRDSLRISSCRQLVQNILCCFLEGDSFRRMTLIPGEAEEHQVQNIHFRRLKSRLYHVLTELQSRFVEYVN